VESIHATISQGLPAELWLYKDQYFAFADLERDI
jgi:hypothetical protein